MRLLSVMLCVSLFAPTVFAESVVKLKASTVWISDAPGEKIEGSAKGFAKLTMSGEDFSTLSGDILMSVKSMRTGNKTRDEHLKSPTWLDAETYPKITFSIAEVKIDKSSKEQREHQGHDGQIEHSLHTASVTGQISIHGVSKPLTASADIDTFTVNGKRRLKITTKFAVKLDDFSIKGKDGIVGKKVGESIAIETTLKGIIK